MAKIDLEQNDWIRICDLAQNVARGIAQHCGISGQHRMCWIAECDPSKLTPSQVEMVLTEGQVMYFNPDLRHVIPKTVALEQELEMYKHKYHPPKQNPIHQAVDMFMEQFTRIGDNLHELKSNIVELRQQMQRQHEERQQMQRQHEELQKNKERELS
jgi:hypothetical protein